MRQGKFADIDPTGIPRMIRQADDEYTFPKKIQLSDGTNEMVIEFDGTDAVITTSSGDVKIDENLKVGGGYGATGVTISAAGKIEANDNLTVDGTTTASTDAVLPAGCIDNDDLAGSVTRAKLLQEAAAVYTIPWHAFKKTGDLTALPTAGDGTNLGIVAGAHGTNSPHMAGKATAAGSTETDKARCTFTLPAEYDAAETITVRLHGRVDVVANTSATVDIECYKSDNEVGISADLCGTVAQDINSATWGDDDFTIDPTGLAVGDSLDIEITTIVNDTGAVAACKSEIGAVQILLDIKG